MNMKKKSLSRKRIALVLAFALIAGLLPLKTPAVSKASGYGVSNPRTADGITTWDCIWFGNYWQEDTNGDGTADKNDAKTPIKWRVLSVNGDDAFLLADKNLDCQKYNNTDTDLTWETCTMRSWLNGYGASGNVCEIDYSSGNFLDNAFTAGEQSAIKTTNVVNEDNPKYGTEGGNNTSDQVYLLSIGEVTNPDYGFTTSTGYTETREAVNTAYVAAGGEINSIHMNSAGSTDVWRLRSPGYRSWRASCVRYYGNVDTYGSGVDSLLVARPALHLNLSSTSSWSYAGTVTSDGGADEEATPAPTQTPAPTPTPACSSDGKTSGTSGSLKIGEDKSGSADESSGVSKFFPASWSLKSTKYPLELSQTENADGTYTIKGSIGIGRSDLLNKESEWKKYKAACDKANKTMSEYDTLYAYKDMFGLKSSTVVHATGWKGSKKPELSVMGYVENTYDAYGRLIKADGRVAGEMAWKGGATWNFVTPVGPMYLKFEAGGKINLSVGPTWDNTDKKMSLDGSLNITPSISLTGGYGLEGVVSVSAKGSCSLPIDLISRNQGSWGTKGSFKAEASVNLFALFVIDKTWTLATYKKTLWDSTNSVKSLANSITDESVETSLMSTEFAEETTKWRGNAKSLNSENAKTLQAGILKSSIPLTAQIGDKDVLVWQDYDDSRSVANSSVLKYSVLQNGTWSTPKAVYDDGFGDSYADLKVIDDELYLVWQKQTKNIESTDVDKVVKELGANSEIYFAKFDKLNNTFDEIEQLTNNDECDMLPQFVKNSDSIMIAYINNDGDIYQKSGTNTIKCFDITNNSTIDIASQSDAIGKYEAFDVDGTVEVTYATTSDEEETSLKTTYDDYQYYLDELSTSENALSVGKINYFDGVIRTIINGKLYQYDIENDTFVSQNAGEESFDNNAVFVSNGEKSAYVWSSYDEETGVGTIKGSIEDPNGQYTNPVELFSTSENVARVLAPILDADGNWRIIANEENGGDSLHSLVYYAKEEEVLSSLLSASVNEFEMNEDKTGIDYIYKNEGDKPVDNLYINVKAEDGTEKKEKIKVNVLPGETVAETAYIDLTSISKGQPIEISVSEENEISNDENTVSEQLAKTNLSIIGKATEENGIISVSALVENKGLDDATGTVELYKDKNKSTKIEQIENVSIASEETSEIDFSISVNDITYDDNGASYLPLCVNATGGDYDESDNTVYLAFYKGKNVNVDTTPQQTVSIVVDEDEESVNPTPSPAPTPTATPTATPTGTVAPTPTASPDKKATPPISSVAFKIQTIKTAKIKTIKAKTLKKKSVKVNLKAKADGNSKLTYKVTKYPKGMKKYIKVNKKGVVTFKKKAKKGTYKIRITAAASGKYKRTTKVISIKVK